MRFHRQFLPLQAQRSFPCWAAFGLALLLGGSPVMAGLITGRAFVDYEGNGVFDSTEYGVQGILVSAFDAAGMEVGSATTSFTGEFALNAAGSGPYRVEFTDLPVHLKPGQQGSTASSVRFVPGGSASHLNLPLIDPVKFNQQANPPVLVTRFLTGTASGAQQSAAALLRVPYQATGNHFSGTTPTSQYAAVSNANFASIGAAYGVAHQSTRQRLYVGAFHKRHSGFGPSGPDAIYVLDATSNAALGVIRLDNLTGTTNSAGSDVHNFTPQGGRVFDIGSAGNTNFESFDGVGKRALGDIELSADMRTLYVVNLFDRRIYALDVSSGQPSQTTLIQVWNAPDATGAGRHRPFALAVHEGRLWVGSVDENGSQAFVHSFVAQGAAPAFTLELTVPLNYPRQAFIGAANNPNRLAHWRAWVANPATLTPMVTNAEEISWPQPMLADIEFDGRDMLLGLRDRFGDQTGYAQRFNLASTVDSYPISAGDLLRVRRLETGWALEGSTTHPTSGGLTQSGPGGAAFPEHYEWDLYNDGAVWDVQQTGSGLHWETAQGSLLQLAGKTTLMTTAMNPFSDFSGGLLRLENTTGRREGVNSNNAPFPTTGAYTLYEGGDYGDEYPADIGLFNEANGLGALEPVLPPAPIQIGNRVWFDSNANGVQDAAETGIGGVVVDLHDANGTLVGSVTTTAGSDPNTLGTYVFNAVSPESTYLVTLSPANFLTGGALAGLRRSPQGTTSNLRDSDGLLLTGLTGAQSAFNGRIGQVLSTAGIGSSDHSIDFGLTACPVIETGPPELPNARVGQSYQQTLTASGSGATAPFAFALAAGAPPAGIGLQTSGTLSGTPESAGLSLFTVRTLDAEGCAGTREIQLRVCPVMTLSPGTLHPAYAFSIYHAALTAEGGAEPYLYTLSSGTLPEGLSLVGNVITGTPVGAPGVSSFVVRAIDSNGCDVERTIEIEVQGKPTSWPAWQARYPLDGNNGPNDNPDGDRFDNLLEFAFDLDPASGVKTRCPIQVDVSPTTATAHVRVLRLTGATGIRYVLETIGNLADSPSGWNEVTSLVPSIEYNNDGTEWAVYANAGTLPTGVSSAFFRCRVELDSDLNGTPEAVVRSETVGVFRRTHGRQIESLSMPFLRCELFSGGISSVTGSFLHLHGSIGSGSLNGALVAGTSYYLEVIDGPQAGHRLDLDEAATTGSAVAIDGTNSRNTLTPPFTALAGATVAVRPHHTLDSVCPKSLFHATNNPSTADRVLVYQNASFRFFWLFLNGGNPRWVLDGDSTLANAGTRVIDPCEGLLLQPRQQNVTLLCGGLVRSNPFACPLPVGFSLRGGGWPMTQSPVQRGASTASGFSGGTNASNADRLLIWSGDATPGAAGYDGHFLLRAGPFNHWTSEQNAALPNLNTSPIFQPLRGALMRARNDNRNYVMPNAWTP